MLDVANGSEPLEGAVVRVHLNTPVLDVEVKRTVLQQDSPRARYDVGRSAVDIALPALERNDRQSFAIDLERI